MSECKCEDNAVAIQNLTDLVKNHEERIDKLETFKKWAKPILEKVQKMQESLDYIKSNQKWMMIIAVGFFAICGYIYREDIVEFRKQYILDQKSLNKTLHKDKLEIINNINEIKLQVIRSSKINHKATVSKIRREFK